MSGKAPDIELSIGELVLHGVPDLQRAALERELRAELTRLLVESPPRGSNPGRQLSQRSINRRHPVEIQLGARSAGAAAGARKAGGVSGEIGHQLAHVIHGAIRR